MNLQQIFPIIIAVIAVMGGRILNEKSLKLLTNEERGMLIQNFSKSRIWSTVILMIIVLAYLGIAYSGAFSTINPTYTYFAILALFMAVRFVMNYRKLRTYNFPSQYYKLTLIQTFLNVLSFGCIVYFILNAFNGEI